LPADGGTNVGRKLQDRWSLGLGVTLLVLFAVLSRVFPVA
jgi:hypothetical protein